MLEKKKIIVADDTTFMRKKIVEYLIENGVLKENIMEAENGIEVIEILKKDAEKYDLLISDLNMPLMNGLQLLKKLRYSEKEIIKNFKFLLLTTESEKEKIVEAIKYKVNGYIIKSSMKERLFSEIERVLNL